MAGNTDKQFSGEDHDNDPNGDNNADTGKPLRTGEDPFDLAELRLSQNFAETAGVRKLLTTVPVGKPSNQDFVRVHSDDAFHVETVVLELKEEGETFLVAKPLWPELAGELTPKVLYLSVNRQGVPRIWPIRLPGEDGRIDNWNASALEAAQIARTRWIRVVANRSLGAYEIFEATGALPEPPWPAHSFQEILNIAFKGRCIAELDHPVIRRLRGEL
jgi:hypothetical protein